MAAQQSQRSARSATTGYSEHPHYTHTDKLDDVSAIEYNQIKTELRVLRVDFDRIFNGYKQLGIAHAELLLDQQASWRQYLLENAYVVTLHPDVQKDIVTFLETVERHSRLKGAST